MKAAVLVVSVLGAAMAGCSDSAKSQIQAAKAAQAKAEADAEAAKAARAEAEAELARTKASKTRTAGTIHQSSDENVFVIRSGFGEAIIQDFRVGNDGRLYDLTILFSVRDGTTCQEDVALVGNERFVRKEYAKITILDGTYRGKSGWIVRDWLRR